MLAYALPSAWLIALSAYLIVAVPATFVAALLAFGSTLSVARNRRSVRRACGLTLFVSALNIGFVIYLLSVDQQPSQPNATDRFWAAIMVAAFIISALAFWLARLSSTHVRRLS